MVDALLKEKYTYKQPSNLILFLVKNIEIALQGFFCLARRRREEGCRLPTDDNVAKRKKSGKYSMFLMRISIISEINKRS